MIICLYNEKNALLLIRKIYYVLVWKDTLEKIIHNNSMLGLISFEKYENY